MYPAHITYSDAVSLVEHTPFFHNLWRVPQCVGAIDGSHIPIMAPEKNPLDSTVGKGGGVEHYLIGDPCRIGSRSPSGHFQTDP